MLRALRGRAGMATTIASRHACSVGAPAVACLARREAPRLCMLAWVGMGFRPQRAERPGRGSTPQLAEGSGQLRRNAKTAVILQLW